MLLAVHISSYGVCRALKKLVMDTRGEFGEHERSERVARGDSLFFSKESIHLEIIQKWELTKKQKKKKRLQPSLFFIEFRRKNICFLLSLTSTKNKV